MKQNYYLDGPKVVKDGGPKPLYSWNFTCRYCNKEYEMDHDHLTSQFCKDCMERAQSLLETTNNTKLVE